ncbi:glycosyltransferase family A protein [Sphingosinicella sp. YJ22]|uniref:glycosyltransferase family 2 protein n=1 Tax=Sphingosinicella sp. YJ22 TaxID=1104780 RepID=UPI00140CD0D5|nr:glycosyltransferase family A protein [Sphingosinicella sp. YJ22]
MTRAPAVSVVLPVHNGRAFVESSIRSILAQDFADFELVVGDDGSDDGTSEVLARLAAEDDRIRVLRRPTKSGLAGSANWVVSEARAPLVAIAHADDICDPSRLRRQVALLARRPDAVLVGALADGIDPRGRCVQPANLSRLLKPSSFAPFAHSTVMFRAEAFSRAGGYRSQADAWEDLDLYWRMAEEGRILVIPEVLARYRHSASSIRERHGDRIEQALDVMYRSAALHGQGRDWSPLLGRPSAGRIHPRIFVARSWVRLWSGRRSHVFGRMLRRAALRPNLVSAQALAFVTWATVSPRSLRLLLQLIGKARNARVRHRLTGLEFVEWEMAPRDPDAVTASAQYPAAAAR